MEFFDPNTYMYNHVPMKPSHFGLIGSMVGIGFVMAQGHAQELGVTDTRLPQVLLDTAHFDGDRYVATLQSGGLAELTLSPSLQRSVETYFRTHHFPFAAAVAISLPDGKVLALAGHSEADPSMGASDLAVRPWAPAASVFKVVAASALLEEGISPMEKTCFHAGISRVEASNLLDLPLLDRNCGTLGFAIGKSQNAIIAKLAAKHLRQDSLLRVAQAFGFGEAIPFNLPTEPSEIDVPDSPLEFARTAAGFWHSSLSVLHGALIAATVANRGIMPMPRLVESAMDQNGYRIATGKLPSRRVLDPAVAASLGKMMMLTTSMGTAKHSFRDPKGRPTMPFEVAGKTGTLNYRGEEGDPVLPGSAKLPKDGFLGYSWFVGFAPAHKPTIAFAVLVGNPAAWRIKAHAVARHLLADYAGGPDTKAIHLMAQQ
jgi:cell division protein FtsI/penicillin-binding protein 2